MSAPDTFRVAFDSSFQRVLKAEWSGTVRADATYYCCTLECGHHTHVSESALRSPLFCMACCKQKLATPEQKDERAQVETTD